MSRQPDEKEKLSGGPAERASILWHSYLTGDHSRLDAPTRAVRNLFKRLPSANRCLVCNAPFEGLGSIVVSLAGFRPGRSNFNPSLCGRCEILVKRHQVGTEIQLTLLFADVRGSTSLAEEIGVG